MAELDVLVVPTASVTPTISDVQRVPHGYNTVLGYYTNFVNLLDMCAMAVPNGFLPSGMPSGISFIGPAWHDELMYEFGRNFQHARRLNLGATGFPLPPATPHQSSQRTSQQGPELIQLAVAGAHMTGLELNGQLTQLGAYFSEKISTAPVYRLIDITKDGDKVKRPGLVKVKEGGVAVEVELWSMGTEKFGLFMKNLKAPLAIGMVELSDGRNVHGFVCEGVAMSEENDISSFGSWKNYLNSK